MCPPPAEPIRPVGPVAGGIYVDRSALPGRVSRRRPRDGSDEDGRGASHHGDEDEAGDGTEAPRWIGSRTPARDAGAYDDHGRAGGGEQDEPPGRLHVDRTA